MGKINRPLCFPQSCWKILKRWCIKQGFVHYKIHQNVGIIFSNIFQARRALRDISFMEDDNTTISAVYAKVVLEWYDCILAVVGPLRVNYKKNIAILKKVLESL